MARRLRTMPRLLGIDIPNNKRVAYALAYIYGVGLTRAVQIIEHLGINPALRSHELTEEQINRIVQFIGERGWKVEGDLRREVTSNLKRLQAIKCYRGLRHMHRLPVRGQRTRTNARTRKGARKTVGIIKKAEPTTTT
jgi:small subunit ribosomal protein S13